MTDTNYVSSIVRILENPVQTVIDKIPVIEFRVQLPQVRNNRIIHLVFWGNLTQDIVKYYQVNDYIVVEGYLSIQNNMTNIIQNEIKITGLRVYPFLLSYNRQIN